MPDFDISTLITDRSARDLERLRDLLATPVADWTAEQLAEFNLARSRGAYNHTDLNRVERAVDYLSGLLRKAGYGIRPAIKRDWTESDIPTADQMKRYLDNVNMLRSAIAVPSATPEPPADMEDLTWAGANAIEQILVNMDETLIRMAATYVACGPATCGGEYL